MPLITCPDCEKRMSTQAYFCPNCGRLAKFGYFALTTLGIVGGLIAMAAVKYTFIDLFAG